MKREEIQMIPEFAKLFTESEAISNKYFQKNFKWDVALKLYPLNISCLLILSNSKF